MKNLIAKLFPAQPPPPPREPTMRDHDHPLLVALTFADGSVCVRCAFTDSADVANYPDFASFLASEHNTIGAVSYPSSQNMRDLYLTSRAERERA